MPAWLNPAGGLRYHARALLARREWQPFRAALAAWLPVFRARNLRAVLVGPSAGYSFSDAFFSQFGAITILEPDPIAGFLLCRRLRRLGIADLRLERSDRLIAPLLRGEVGLPELLEADPGACLIFGNVLGQTRFLIEDPNFERFKSAFRERNTAKSSSRAGAVLRQLYASDRLGIHGELFDHQSDGFFASDQPHTYFDWRIGGARHHLIEAVRSAPESWPGALR